MLKTAYKRWSNILWLQMQSHAAAMELSSETPRFTLSGNTDEQCLLYQAVVAQTTMICFPQNISPDTHASSLFPGDCVEMGFWVRNETG